MFYCALKQEKYEYLQNICVQADSHNDSNMSSGLYLDSNLILVTYQLCDLGRVTLLLSPQSLHP